MTISYDKYTEFLKDKVFIIQQTPLLKFTIQDIIHYIAAYAAKNNRSLHFEIVRGNNDFFCLRVLSPTFKNLICQMDVHYYGVLTMDNQFYFSKIENYWSSESFNVTLPRDIFADRYVFWYNFCEYLTVRNLAATITSPKPVDNFAGKLIRQKLLVFIPYLGEY